MYLSGDTVSQHIKSIYLVILLVNIANLFVKELVLIRGIISVLDVFDCIFGILNKDPIKL